MIETIRKYVHVDVVELAAVLIGMTFSFIIGLPMLLALGMSFSERSAVFGPPNLIPGEPTIAFWVEFLDRALPFLINSAIIGVGVSILALLIAIPGAYAFARKEFPWRKRIFYAIIFILLVPEVIVLIPIVQIIRWVNLFDTMWGIWLALIIGNIPLSIWLLRDNFQKLPPNIENAAQVYGCTEFQAFRLVVLPLATPIIIAVAFLIFQGAFTEFVFTNMLSTEQGAMPAIVHLFRQFNPDIPVNWPYTMAGSYIITLPPLVFYIIARKYLEEAMF